MFGIRLAGPSASKNESLILIKFSVVYMYIVTYASAHRSAHHNSLIKTKL